MIAVENMSNLLIKFLSSTELIYKSLDSCFVRDSISDSLTVLVGFVAIGIPLSLQVISKASERYKSDHVINYLSNWKLVTPKKIYWVSILYIIFALTFSSLMPKDCNNYYSHYSQLYAWILVASFLIVLIVVGFWFGHMFTQASKSPKEIYDALKK